MSDYLDTGKHTYTGSGGACTRGCSVWCFFGLHRWTYPGGWCECCGKLDNFLDYIKKTRRQMDDAGIYKQEDNHS